FPSLAPRQGTAAMHNGAARARTAARSFGESVRSRLARQLDELDLVPLGALQHGNLHAPRLEYPSDLFRLADQRAVVTGLDVVVDQADRAVAVSDGDVAAILVLHQHQVRA